LLADAERLAAGQTTMLGNWSLGQIYMHLAKAIDTAIDGNPFMLPAPVRWVTRPLLKKRFLTRSLTPGFKIPGRAAALQPAEISTAEGLAALRAAIARQKTDRTRAVHPILGTLTIDEWNAFHLRHAEMHMSFAVPAERRA
jgi:hypothetical protein